MKMEFLIGKNKKIYFISGLDKFHPVSAKKFIPTWYKNAEQHFVDSKEIKKAGLKKCVPFLDIMTSGYMILLQEDAIVKIENGIPVIQSNMVFERDAKMGSTIPRPYGHTSNNFVWHNSWAWRTPKGWSTIVTHPYNRFDLPFTTLSGFVESDNLVLGGNIPFYLKKDFEGVIPAGTPIAQIIPVRRRRWVSKIINKKIAFDGTYTGEDHYKKYFWRKKQYD